MTDQTLSPKYLLAEQRLAAHRPALRAGDSLAGWLRAHRADGMSWRWISIELARITQVVVSDVTLARWVGETDHSVSYQVDPFTLIRGPT